MIGVDSGPLHLAAALAKPGVAIYGPTDPARHGPYGGTFTVLRSPSRHDHLSANRASRTRACATSAGSGVGSTGSNSFGREQAVDTRMSVFPKPYADVVQRLRVTGGFVLVAAFAWFSQPNLRSLALGLPVSLIGVVAARLGHRPPGEKHPAGRERPVRLRPQSALSRNSAGGGRPWRSRREDGCWRRCSRRCSCSSTCRQSSSRSNICSKLFPEFCGLLEARSVALAHPEAGKRRTAASASACTFATGNIKPCLASWRARCSSLAKV